MTSDFSFSVGNGFLFSIIHMYISGSIIHMYIPEPAKPVRLVWLWPDHFFGLIILVGRATLIWVGLCSQHPVAVELLAILHTVIWVGLCKTVCSGQAKCLILALEWGKHICPERLPIAIYTSIK